MESGTKPPALDSEPPFAWLPTDGTAPLGNGSVWRSSLPCEPSLSRVKWTGWVSTF